MVKLNDHLPVNICLVIHWLSSNRPLWVSEITKKLWRSWNIILFPVYLPLLYLLPCFKGMCQLDFNWETTYTTSRVWNKFWNVCRFTFVHSIGPMTLIGRQTFQAVFLNTLSFDQTCHISARSFLPSSEKGKYCGKQLAMFTLDATVCLETVSAVSIPWHPMLDIEVKNTETDHVTIFLKCSKRH